VIFSGNFSESWISTQNRDTRAILLKTMLVHVSCIQSTQIRGKTIAKGFRKVDTFWTYHMTHNSTVQQINDQPDNNNSTLHRNQPGALIDDKAYLA
jgi:hypothetical protein